MEAKDLKLIVGAAKPEEPAVIRLFGEINATNVQAFINEFLFLQNEVKPSKIAVLINSEGGSVVDGMSAYSTIANSPIATDCVVEGIAASMGSIIWAAGDNLYMHDYSLLMIHNPFCAYRDTEDPTTQATVAAFKKQISTIYEKRFRMSRDTVAAIMDGENGADGTFFTARAAVKAGILPKGNIISTAPIIKSEMEELTQKASAAHGMAEMGEIVKAIAAKLECVPDVKADIQEDIKDKPNRKKKMAENEMLYGAVAAQLGLQSDAPVSAVAERVSQLLKAESLLEDANANLTQTEIKLQGKTAELKNAAERLAEVENLLKKYQDAEEAARNAEMGAVIDAAVKAGKIADEAKASWMELAKKDFEMVKATLESIQGSVKISEEIATDADNVKDAQAAMTEAEDLMRKKVAEVVGKDMKLRTF